MLGERSRVTFGEDTTSCRRQAHVNTTFSTRTASLRLTCTTAGCRRCRKNVVKLEASSRRKKVGPHIQQDAEEPSLHRPGQRFQKNRHRGLDPHEKRAGVHVYDDGLGSRCALPRGRHRAHDGVEGSGWDRNNGTSLRPTLHTAAATLTAHRLSVPISFLYRKTETWLITDYSYSKHTPRCRFIPSHMGSSLSVKHNKPVPGPLIEEYVTWLPGQLKTTTPLSNYRSWSGFTAVYWLTPPGGTRATSFPSPPSPS